MFIKVLLIVVFMCLAGCAGPVVKTNPVTDFSAKETMASFTFLPPQEAGWMKAQFAQNWINFLKKSELDHTYSAWAKLVKLPKEVGDGEGLISLIKDSQDKDNDPQRFKVLIHNNEIDTSRKELCVKSHWLAEDHNAQKQSTDTHYLLLNAYGLICRHPFDKSVLIDFHYSERYKPSDDVSGLQGSASSFLNNVKFEGVEGDSQGIAIKDEDISIADRSGQISCNYHVLVEKNNGKWEIKNIEESTLKRSGGNQEILCANSGIDTIAPDWSSYSGRQTGVVGDCTLVDGIDHAVDGEIYNECSSTLASTSVGRSLLLNTLGLISSGSAGYSRVTDKELIRKIVKEVGFVKQVTEYKNMHSKISEEPKQ